MIQTLEFIADHTGLALGCLFAFILLAAVIRVVVRKRRGEQVEITPVGIVNDLPDSVTGVNKYADALIVEENDKEKLT